MATELASAYVQIIPSAKGISGKLSQIMDGEADSAGKSSGNKFSQAFGGMLKGAGVMAASAVGAATTAVGALGKAAISAGSEYESAFAQVETIMDSSVVSTEDMSNAIQDLSSSMGISASELSNTVYNAISATGDTANAVSLAGQASKLATAGFTDTGSALSVLTTAMNAYGLSAEEASNISDSLIAVQNLGVTTVSELSASMGKAIASASAYNVNLSNLESAYVSLTKGGINTAESTTYISSMLKELGSDGSKVSDIIMEETGKSFADLMNEGKTLGDVLGVLNESVDGDATALMNLWSSAEAGKASNAILTQGLDQFNDNLKSISESAGITQTAYETMADTLEHKTDVFKTLGTNLLTSVYSGMEGELGSFVDFGNEALQAISDGFESGGISGAITALGTVISDAVSMIAEKAPEIVNVGMSLLQALGDGLMSNIDVILDAAGQVVMSLLDGMVSATDGNGGQLFKVIEKIVGFLKENAPAIINAGMAIITNLIAGIGQSLPTLIPTVAQVLVQIIEGIIQNIPMLIEAGVQVIVGLIEGITQALPILIDALPTVITGIINALLQAIPVLIQGAIQLVNGLVQAMPQIIPALIEAAPQILTGIIGALVSNAPMLVDAFIQLFGAVGSAWGDISMMLIQSIPQSFVEIANAFMALGPILVDTFNQIMTMVGPTFSQLGVEAQTAWAAIQSAFANVGEWFRQKFTTASNGVKTAFNNVKSFFQNLWKSIQQVFSDAVSKFTSIGSNIAKGILKGLSSSWENLKAFLQKACGDLIALAKRILGIASPSKEFASQVGQWIPAGIAQGIQNGMGVLNKEIRSMTDNMLVGSIKTSTEAVSSVNFVPDMSSKAAGGSVVINNNIRVDGAKDPEAWTQTFFKTLEREARMA